MRDEEEFLDGCLASIVDVVDEIVVVDTGSRDASRRIARRYGARVIEHAWEGDFAAARNIGLDAARGEWILYIDADERLAPAGREQIEALLEGSPAVAFRLLLRPRPSATPYREHRLWRHDPRVRFRGRMHEKVTPAIEEVSRRDGRPVHDCELLLEHLGYEGDQTAKHRRNLPLLRAQLAVEPNNLFNRHHLVRVLRGLGEDAEAEELLLDTVELARRRPLDHQGVLAFLELIDVRRMQGEDVAALVEEARSRYPATKQLWWVEAQLAIAKGDHVKALESLDRLVTVDLASLPDADPGSYDVRIFGERAQASRGDCLFALGRFAAAAEAYGMASAFAPEVLEYSVKQRAALGRLERTAGPDLGAPLQAR